MMLNLKLYLASLILLPAIDYVWLSSMMNFYRTQLGELARTSNGQMQILPIPVLLVYVVLALGLVALVLPNSESWESALAKGAIFGLVVYGVYDLTNLATLKDYSSLLAVVDISWGVVLNAVAAAAMFLVREKIA